MAKKLGSVSHDPFMDSLYTNERVFNDYLQRLQNLAINVYEWKGLPETVDPRFLELILINRGFAVFFKDENTKEFYALMSANQGNFDIYHIAKDRRAYAVNGYNKELNDKNSVLIFNNYLHLDSMRTLEIFAMRLTEVQRTIDTNVIAQKTPLLIKCTESQRLTLKNIFLKYRGNQDAIFVDETLDLGGISTLDTKAPYVADDLQVLKKQIWDEALNFMAIETSNTEKRERLITDEVTSNLGYVESERYIGLNARRQACKMINEMFGLDVSVDFRSKSTSIDTSDEELERSPAI